MFATQVITNDGEDNVEITSVTFPATSGAEVTDWFLVGLDEYMYATGASPDIPPAPAGSEPTLQPGETKRVAVVLKVTADHTTGAVTVTGTDFTDEQVAAAVAEAGYTLK